MIIGGEGEDAADQAGEELNEEIAGQESGDRDDAVESGNATKKD